MDQVTLQRIQLLHPKVRAEVDNIYRNQIVPALTGRAICRFAYTLRTFAEQNALYAQGRTKLYDASGKRLGVVTKAKGGQSIHNYGLAFDIVILYDNDGNGTFEEASWSQIRDFDKDSVADWREVTNYFKSKGWEWGGDWKTFKDAPHFQMTFKHTWASLLRKIETGDVIIDENGITYPKI
jgi:peptidoglycan L-alanyl-D-glutamate endopeptidase CwlK